MKADPINDAVDPSLTGLDKEDKASFTDGVVQDESELTIINVLQYVEDGHILKRMAQAVAKALWLPETTVFIAGLGVLSGIAMRKFAVRYEDGSSLPLGLYIVAEHPSGSAKTRCLKIYLEPFHRQIIAIKHKAIKEIKKLKSQAELSAEDTQKLAERDRIVKAKVFLTNTTEEGLEAAAIVTNGYFTCVSAEQGLFNTLLGIAYKDNKKATNNDMVLEGYAGEFHAGSRVTREAFHGYVKGSVILFAQEGSFAKIFGQSNGTGLSERFVAVAEPDFMGERDYENTPKINKELLEKYANFCGSFEPSLYQQADIWELQQLAISETGYQLIKKFRNSIEPFMKQGGRYSHPSARSMASKVDMLIMKIAALLHISGVKDWFHHMTIEDHYIEAAINISWELLEATVRLCGKIGVMGQDAEVDAITSVFRTNPRSRSLREIQDTVKGKAIFKTIKNKRPYIEGVVKRAVKAGMLVVEVDPNDGKARFRHG